MNLKYKIMRTDPETKVTDYSGITYECKEDETGDDALAFAKQLQEFFNDGKIYEIGLTG